MLFCGRRPAIVVTSINAPSAAMRQLTSGAVEAGAQMIVIGDIQSPSDFLIEGSRFLSMRDQIATGFKFAGLCSSRSYARKNVGYLVAAAGGAKIIVETDDDNVPRSAFFGPRFRIASANVAINEGWLNVYRHFANSNSWPRGLPSDHVGDAVRAFDDLWRRTVDAPESFRPMSHRILPWIVAIVLVALANYSHLRYIQHAVVRQGRFFRAFGFLSRIEGPAC